MKTFLLTIFRKNKKGIIFIWILDSINIIFQMFFPLLIGKTIDDLINGKYLWLYIFIAVNIISLSINTINKYFDNRVYTKVSYNTIMDYTERAANINVSIVSARIGYVDSIIEVIRYDLTAIFTIFGSILFIVVYLFANNYYYVFAITLLVSIISFFIQKRVRMEIFHTQKKLNDEAERQISCLETKKSGIIGRHFLRLFSFQIKLSDIDARTYFAIYLLQIVFIGLSLWILIATNDIISAGAIFTVVTYISELNGYATEIPEYYQKYLWLQDASQRLDITHDT